MPFSNNFPYTDLHEININKFLKAIKNLLGGHGGEFLKKQSNIPFDYAWEPVEVSAPVQSVNGKTGAVVLDYQDVGALPDSYTPPPAPVQSVNGQTGAVVLDYQDVGALPDSYTPPPAPVQSVNGQIGAVVLDAEDVGALTDTTKYAESNSVAGPAKKTETIPYGECDSTSTATAFTATVPGITELKNGTVMLLKNGVVTSASGFTININGLGAKPSYGNMTTGNDVTPTAPTRDTTIFNINYTMLFIYDETLVSGGCWISYRGYDSNANTIGYQIRTNSMSLPMKSVVYRYRILFTSADGKGFVPANNSTSTNATTARNITQEKIDPFGSIVYYGATASVSAGSRPSAAVLWQQYNFTIGYSFVVALTAWKPVYLKCSPQSDGSAIIDSTTPFVQNLPSSNDGKIYIFMGVAYSSTAMELTINHPVYYHDGTSIKLWIGGTSSSGAVDSVNGQTGTVVLDASDVGALPDTYTAPVQSVNGQTGAVVLDADDVGALPDTTTAADINGMSKWNLLWTNSNPSSSFASQTIPLNLSGYDMVMVIYQHWTSADVNNSAFCRIGQYGRLLSHDYTLAYRDYHPETTGVFFNVGLVVGTYNNSNVNQNASAVIPLQIYGIKL